MNITTLENSIQKPIATWNLFDLSKILTKYEKELELDDIIMILENSENLEVKNALQSTLILKNYTHILSKILKLQESEKYEDDLLECTKSNSYIERLHAWTALILQSENFNFSEYSSQIREDFEKYLENLISMENYKNIMLTSDLLDLAFFFLNIYYYKSGEDIYEIYSNSEVNKILERMNHETNNFYPFLAKENLDKFPDIKPEDLGLLDITKVKE